jgi:4-amino-4-deoxy-L-arabinose transferase-like glycosyltransferase
MVERFRRKPPRMAADRRRFPLALFALSTVAGLFVLWVATDLFPYHSVNHDEGVYLQQARLLLGGDLWFETPTPDAFRHWFFVEDGTRLYPKYQPVVPALFALGLAVGWPRLVLALVAAATVALVGLLTTEAFDRRAGLLAAALCLCSPLFVLTSSVFLPYAPTTAFDLLFALGYVRALRRESLRWAGVAGLAVGLAFFARPYTAVLFALPFVVHACWTLWRARDDRPALRWALSRNLVIGALGGGFVALALAYNLVVTGDALLFPYAAFAPTDGIGFGFRRLLDHGIAYTPALAFRANGHVLWEFATRWTALAPLGTLLALVGGAGALAAARGRLPASLRVLTRPANATGLSDVGLRALFAGVVLSVALGNVAFWGNYNILADFGDPTDGFIAQFGPIYHFDLLLPLSAFGAFGGLLLARGATAVARTRVSGQHARFAVALALLVTTPATVAVQGPALGHAVADHREQTARYESAYEPFEDRALSGALVFVPTPYGDWLGHPFQSLSNDPGLDGDVVYALDRSPAGDFAVLDAYPDRETYRYTFRGEWDLDPEPVHAALVPLDVREGSEHRITTRVGVLGSPSSVRLEGANETVTYDVTGEVGETLTVEWVVTPEGVRVVEDGLQRRSDAGAVALDGAEEVSLAITFVQEGGATVTYRQELVVEERGNRVRVVWPPETEVCRLTPDCGHRGMYLPGADDYLAGVAVNATVETSVA